MLVRSALPLAAVAAVAAAFTLALVACGPPKMPTGPAPEYEDPPAPSWMKDAGEPIAADAGAA